MTDYLDALLPAGQDEGDEDVLWQLLRTAQQLIPRRPRSGRAEWQGDVSARAAADEAEFETAGYGGVAEALLRAVRAGGFPEETQARAALPTRREGPEGARRAAEAALTLHMQAQGQVQAQTQAERLRRSVVQVHAQAAYRAPSGQELARPLVGMDEAGAQTSAWEVDRQFQRDARRYDGALSLYR